MPNAVVTGANSGIGHAFAQVLIREVYLVFSPVSMLIVNNFIHGIRAIKNTRV